MQTEKVLVTDPQLTCADELEYSTCILIIIVDTCINLLFLQDDDLFTYRNKNLNICSH